jgi:hypothetical protein
VLKGEEKHTEATLAQRFEFGPQLRRGEKEKTDDTDRERMTTTETQRQIMKDFYKKEISELKERGGL